MRFFFFNDTATTEIYTLSLHDALPISECAELGYEEQALRVVGKRPETIAQFLAHRLNLDRKSTRLNSSHSQISYAVFCLKKKKKQKRVPQAASGPVSSRPWQAPARAVT